MTLKIDYIQPKVKFFIEDIVKFRWTYKGGLRFDLQQIKSFPIDLRLQNNYLRSRFDPVKFRAIQFLLLYLARNETNMVCFRFDPAGG